MGLLVMAVARAGGCSSDGARPPPTPSSCRPSFSACLCPAVNRHRTVMNLFDKKPTLGQDAFVAPTAAVIGDVTLGDKASVFYGSVVKGAAAGIACVASGILS